MELEKLNLLLENEIRQEVKSLLQGKIDARVRKAGEDKERSEVAMSEASTIFFLSTIADRDASRDVARVRDAQMALIHQKYARETRILGQWQGRQKELDALSGSALYDLLRRIHAGEDVQSILDKWPSAALGSQS